MKSFTDDIEFSAWAARPFTSSEASAAAFADPRYKTSADFREAVAQKTAISNNIGVTTRVVARDQTGVVNSFAALRQTPEGQAQAEGFRAAEQTLREERGPQAARPLNAVEAEKRRIGEARAAEEELRMIFGDQAVRPSAPPSANTGYDASQGWGYGRKEGE